VAKKAKKKASSNKGQVEKLDDFSPLQQALALSVNASPPAVITSLEDFLENEDVLIQATELIANGASSSSIEMAIGLEPGQLDQWLRIGQKERDGAFRILYLWYMRAAAVPKSNAEMSLLAKSPDKWLEKIDIQSQLNRPRDVPDDLPNNTVDGSTSTPSIPLQSYAEFDDDELAANTSSPPEKDDETDDD
jgi:hypothetical protein